MAVFGMTGWQDEGWVQTARGLRRLLRATPTDRFHEAPEIAVSAGSC